MSKLNHVCHRCGGKIRPRQDSHVTLALKVRECAVSGSGSYRESSYAPFRLCAGCWDVVGGVIADQAVSDGQ